MSQPKNLFQSNQPQAKAANIQQLTKQVQYWQMLTKIIQPLLPQPEHWQVVCYQQGVLTITGENQAMISQLGYLQQHYVAQLSQREEFKDLQNENKSLVKTLEKYNEEMIELRQSNQELLNTVIEAQKVIKNVLEGRK